MSVKRTGASRSARAAARPPNPPRTMTTWGMASLRRDSAGIGIAGFCDSVDVARETAAVVGVGTAGDLAELSSVVRLEVPARAPAQGEGAREDHQTMRIRHHGSALRLVVVRRYVFVGTLAGAPRQGRAERSATS